MSSTSIRTSMLYGVKSALHAQGCIVWELAGTFTNDRENSTHRSIKISQDHLPHVWMQFKITTIVGGTSSPPPLALRKHGRCINKSCRFQSVSKFRSRCNARINVELGAVVDQQGAHRRRNVFHCVFFNARGIWCWCRVSSHLSISLYFSATHGWRCVDLAPKTI